LDGPPVDRRPNHRSDMNPQHAFSRIVSPAHGRVASGARRPAATEREAQLESSTLRC
jgi:hypothetical protein